MDSTDVALVDTEPERINVGEAIARGILDTLGIAYEAENSPQEASKLYRVQVGAYKDKRNADAVVARLRAAGFDAIITT